MVVLARSRSPDVIITGTVNDRFGGRKRAFAGRRRPTAIAAFESYTVEVLLAAKGPEADPAPCHSSRDASGSDLCDATSASRLEKTRLAFVRGLETVMANVPAMHLLRRNDLPFPVHTDGAREHGVYAEERSDGMLASVSYWRAGRCLAELVIADGEASWRTIDGFVPLADGDEPTDPDGFRQWLEGVPLQRLRDLANGTQRCAFCEKSSTEVAKLVMGPKVGICNECAALCAEIVSTQPDRGPRDHGRDR